MRIEDLKRALQELRAASDGDKASEWCWDYLQEVAKNYSDFQGQYITRQSAIELVAVALADNVK